VIRRTVDDDFRVRKYVAEKYATERSPRKQTHRDVRVSGDLATTAAGSQLP
jgi:hypothetical protein